MHIGLLGFEADNSLVNSLKRQFLTKDKDGRVQNIVTTFSISNIFEHFVPVQRKERVMRWKEPVLLSDCVSERPDIDVLIIEQSYLHYINDLSIPVIYKHNEMFSPPTCWTPDIILYNNYEMFDFVHQYYPNYHSKIKRFAYSYPAAEPAYFNPNRKKPIKFVNIGPPTDTFDKRRRDFIWNNMQDFHNKVQACFRDEGLGTDITDHDIKPSEYKDLLETSEFVLISNNWGTYLGRRQCEALAAGCIPVMMVENQDCMRNVTEYGFIDGSNCLMFADLEQLREAARYIEIMTPKEVLDMRTAGMKLLLERHTFEHRAKQILAEINLFTQKHLNILRAYGMYKQSKNHRDKKLPVEITVKTTS
jgi:hypothetical protein